MDTSPNITLDMNLSASSSILSDFHDEESSTDLTNDSSVLVLQTKKSYEELEQENEKLTQLLLLQLKEVEKQHQTILDENEQLSKENLELRREAAKHKEELCKYEALKQRLKLAGLAEINFEEEASSGPISSKDIESNEMTVDIELESEVEKTIRTTTGSHDEGIPGTSASDNLHFPCTVKECGERFNCLNLLKTHMKAWHDLEHLSKFGCRKCGQTFPSRSELRIHQWMQHHRQSKRKPNAVPVGMPSPSASIKKASSVPTTQEHGKDLSQADANGRTKSCLCGRKFSKEGSLYNHLYYYPKNGSKFSCSVCQSKFRNTSHLRVHMKQKHQLNITGKGCSQCGRLFKSIRDLIKHKQKVHSGNEATSSSPPSNPVFNGTLAETPITSV